MATKQFRWGKWLSLAAIAALGAGGVIWYLKKGDPEPEYQTATVSRGDIIEMVTATGQLSPVVSVQVGSQVSGRIKALYVDFNSTVRSNQLIAEIDPSTYHVAVLRAEAQLSNSMANLALAEVEARRAESLFASRLISAAEHDTAMARLQQAQAQVKSDQANLESAKVDLSRCSIYAPVDGVVISRDVDVGQTVAASLSAPTLFVIANDLSKMQIGALVSEADIGGVQVGQTATFTVDAFPFRTFRGQVTQIRYGAITNQNVVNYSCIIDVENRDLKLLPSMTANVSIITRERENALRIPNAALRFRPPETASETRTNTRPQQMAGAGGQRFGGGERRGGPGGRRGGGGREEGDRPVERTVHLFVKTEGGKPELKPVRIKTGITDGVHTEVVEGLNEGDPVVTSMIVPGDAPPAAQGPANPFGGPGGGRGFRRF